MFVWYCWYMYVCRIYICVLSLEYVYVYVYAYVYVYVCLFVTVGAGMCAYINMLYISSCADMYTSLYQHLCVRVTKQKNSRKFEKIQGNLRKFVDTRACISIFMCVRKLVGMSMCVCRTPIQIYARDLFREIHV